MPIAMMYLVFLLYVLPINSHIHTSLYSHRKDTSMKQYLKQFATSKWLDVLGVVLVVGIAISAGYLNSRLEKFVDWGLGLLSFPLDLFLSSTLAFLCCLHDLQGSSTNGEIISAL